MIEKRFRWPRIWSNNELKKFASLFSGDIINVSGWTDEDKEGDKYSNYFTNKNSYSISNFSSDKKGLQGFDNEFYLDLEKDLPTDLISKYDVVFNHTTLEHVFDCFKAFNNLCLLSKDVVIVVVPYLQQVHGLGYLDYWRFTPHTMKQLYENNGMKLRYCSANGGDDSSIYLFCIGYKSDKFDHLIPNRFDLKLEINKPLYGSNYENVIGSKLFDK
jgi:hypothetical protein